MIEQPTNVQIMVPDLVTSSIGVCPSPSGKMVKSHSKCLNAGYVVMRPVSPTLKAARVESLMDLRSAMTALRYVKKAWSENYGRPALEAALLQLHTEWKSENHGAAHGHSLISELTGRSHRNMRGSQHALSTESGRIKAITRGLRRRLIHDGMADGNMTDAQIAQDLGL